MKIHNLRKKYRLESVKESFNANNELVKCMLFDGKKTEGLTKIDNKRRKVVIDYYTFANGSGKYLTHAPLTDRSTSDNIANIILETLKHYNSENIVVALAADGTVLNTGRLGGALVLVEKRLGRPLHWLICQLHGNELPFR